MGFDVCHSLYVHCANSFSGEREDKYARVLSHDDLGKSPSMSSSFPDHVHPTIPGLQIIAFGVGCGMC